MELILKRGTEYTPIVFQLPELSDRKYCKLITSNSQYVPTEDTFKLDLSSSSKSLIDIRNSRLQTSYSRGYGIIVRTNNSKDIIALVVTDSFGEKYVIVNRRYINSYPTYFNRIKKSMKELNISTRNRLLIWENDKINSEFFGDITPKMDDYSPEVQFRLSSEFVESQLSQLVTND